MRALMNVWIAAVLVALAGPAAAQTGPVPAAPGAAELHVTGEGRVEMAPDMATIRLGVVAQADDPAAASEAIAGPLAELLSQLSAAGVAEGDMQTSALRLSPVYGEREGPGSGPVVTGFEAMSDVSVELDDPARVGEIVGVALGAGANRFDGLSFGLSEPGEARDRALSLAVEDARRKAEVLASAAGRTLGALTRLVEEGAEGPGQPMMRMEAAQSGAIPTAPGAIDVTARVAVRFALEP